MRAVDELKAMREAGFPDEEIGKEAFRMHRAMSEAGFPQHVIDTEFGHPPFDPKPIVDHFNTSLERTRASASADS
ncbi:MAG: hypothetical protein OEV08_07300, partial [Nitrospira sp.]|nr:hypothetical protein [Nitrospira sp.]